MLADVGKPGELVVLRNNEQQLLRIIPGPFPVKWPELPGPTELGSPAPEVKLLPFQGAVAQYTRPKTEHLLFFWATWCGPCKAAVPELLDFEKERKVPVVAVTNEDVDVLKAFLQRFDKPFPNAIGIDAKRRSFVDYGVSGTPTFVLIDKTGKVTWRQVGYRPSQGLTIPGWTWSGRPQ
jgi:thiol-disulfide isomerase/thioredoxin